MQEPDMILLNSIYSEWKRCYKDKCEFNTYREWYINEKQEGTFELYLEYCNNGIKGTYFHFLIEKECEEKNIEDLANYISWVQIENRLGEFNQYQEDKR